MRRLIVLVLLGAVIVALPKILATSELPSQASGLLGLDRPERVRATVVRVSDGDTLRVRLPDGSEEHVRILGIDTPEVHATVECGGHEASAAMGRLAPAGTTVALVSDPSQGDRDRYDRLLRYVIRSGDDLGLEQVESGLAQVFVFHDAPFERVESYQRVERRAHRAGRGSWSGCWR